MAGVEVWGPPPNAVAPTITVSTQQMPRMSLWRRLEEKWSDIQVGRQGSYSVERLESLDLYCKTTSKTRVILVCLFTPIPALLTAVLIECIPLRDPADGWAANWAFWVRLLLVQSILAYGVNSQMIRFIPGLNFSVPKRIFVAVGVSISFVGVSLVAASTIGFPIPLMMQFSTFPIGIFTSTMILIALGSVLFANESPLKVHFDRYNKYFLTFMVLCGSFPIYKVLYEQVSERYRGLLVAILPVFKFAGKHLMVHSTRELEDMKPTLVALSVDFMSTLFISVCMSTAGSMSLTVLFIGADIGQSVLEFREMRTNSKLLLQLLNDRKHSQVHQHGDDSSLLTMVRATIRDSGSFRAKSFQGVRLWACLRYPLTKEKETELNLLDASGVYQPKDEPSSNLSSKRLRIRWTQLASITPLRLQVAPAVEHLAGTTLTATPDEQHDTNSRRAERSKKLVVQGLQLLFHCEYVVLVEYVECVVPLVFVVFKSILEKLPNIAYYPGGAGNWTMEAAAGVLVLVVLEIGSLLFLSSFLKRKFALSPLYQLAFVIETEVYPVQAILFVMILVVLQYELQHFGIVSFARLTTYRSVILLTCLSVFDGAQVQTLLSVLSGYKTKSNNYDDFVLPTKKQENIFGQKLYTLGSPSIIARSTILMIPPPSISTRTRDVWLSRRGAGGVDDRRINTYGRKFRGECM